MAFCPYCGNEITYRTDSCPYCGRKITVDESSLIHEETNFSDFIAELEYFFPNRVIDLSLWNHQRWDTFVNWYCNEYNCTPNDFFADFKFTIKQAHKRSSYDQTHRKKASPKIHRKSRALIVGLITFIILLTIVCTLLFSNLNIMNNSNLFRNIVHNSKNSAESIQYGLKLDKLADRFMNPTFYLKNEKLDLQDDGPVYSGDLKYGGKLLAKANKSSFVYHVEINIPDSDVEIVSDYDNLSSLCERISYLERGGNQSYVTSSEWTNNFCEMCYSNLYLLLDDNIFSVETDTICKYMTTKNPLIVGDWEINVYYGESWASKGTRIVADRLIKSISADSPNNVRLDYITAYDKINPVNHTVYFGNYEQDGVYENGRESIEWIVLAQKNDSYLLMSKYVLEAKAYNSSREEVSWEESELRNWLNSDFYSESFSNEEKSKISQTVLLNYDREKKLKFANKNGINVDINQENNYTEDNVFILSFDELNQLIGFSEYHLEGIADPYLASENLICYATKHAERTGAFCRKISDFIGKKTNYTFSEKWIGENTCYWWIRNTTKFNSNNYAYQYGGDLKGDYAYVIQEDGFLDNIDTESSISNDEMRLYPGVRPAIWIKVNREEMESLSFPKENTVLSETTDISIAEENVFTKNSSVETSSNEVSPYAENENNNNSILQFPSLNSGEILQNGDGHTIYVNGFDGTTYSIEISIIRAIGLDCKATITGDKMYFSSDEGFDGYIQYNGQDYTLIFENSRYPLETEKIFYGFYMQPESVSADSSFYIGTWAPEYDGLTLSIENFDGQFMQGSVSTYVGTIPFSGYYDLSSGLFASYSYGEYLVDLALYQSEYNGEISYLGIDYSIRDQEWNSIFGTTGGTVLYKSYS